MPSASSGGGRTKEDERKRQAELRFLKQEEEYLMELISAVDRKITGLQVDAMVLTKQMRMCLPRVFQASPHAPTYTRDSREGARAVIEAASTASRIR